MNSRRARALLAKRRAGKTALRIELPRFTLDTYLFAEQLAFVTDPEKYVTACCSVRSGKTNACAADLVWTALTMPGTTGLYITLARSSAKRIVWPVLKSIARNHGLPCEFNEADLSVKFKNGSMIYCTGANTEGEIEKLRGLSNVALAYLDESQAFRAHIKELVEEILAKRLYDTDGRLRMIGTPGPIPAGYFWEACHNAKAWKHHHWTMHNNPWLKKKSGKSPEELIAADCERKGVDITDPSIQRECFGRWVLDTSNLLLTYNPEVNDYDTLPGGTYETVLAIDLGFEDADALAVVGWNDHSPKAYLVEEQLTEKQTIDQLVAQIDVMIAKYNPCKIVIDEGGLGKKISETIKARFGLPLIAADKAHKMANYALLNNALRSGKFMAKKDSRFAQDCHTLEIDRDKSTPEKAVVKGHSDSVDATLYAFKEALAFAFEPKKKAPVVGTKAWHDEQNRDIWEKEKEKMQQEQEESGNWPSEGGWSKW